MQPQLLTAEQLTWFKPFIPQTKENRAALRTAIAALAAILLAFALHLDKPYWSGMTAVILANIYTGNIIDKAIMRIAGTIVGAWLGYWLAGFIANSFFLYLLTCFMLVAVAVYYYNFSIYAYAYLLVALSGIIVISELAINPDAAYWVAIWRPIEIGLGVVVSAAAAFCLFPNNIHDELSAEISLLFDHFQQVLSQFEKSLLQADTKTKENLLQSIYQFKKRVRKSTEMIGFMRREIGFKPEKIDQFRLLLDSFYNLSNALFYATTDYQYAQIKIQVAAAKQSMFDAVQHDLTMLKAAFIDQSIGSSNLASTPVLTDFNQDPKQKSFELSHLFRRINNSLLSLNTVVLQGNPVPTRKRNLITAQQRLQTDPDVVKHSIKAGLSVTLALVFWLISNWPGGLNGLISSIVISIRSNIHEMKNISIYRLIGCFAGGGLALFALGFFAFNLYDFIIIIFFAVWGFSWFSFRYTALAYIGLQANIALIISLAQAGGPPVFLGPALERLGGILIGISASFIVANALWRTDLIGLLRRKLTKLSNYLAYNTRQILTPDSRLPLHELSNLFWLCRGLIETLDAKSLNLREQQQADAAKDEFQQLVLVQATLSHLAENIDQKQARQTLAQCGYTVDLFHWLNQGSASDIQQEIDKILKTLTNRCDLPHDELENAVAYLMAIRQLNVQALFTEQLS